MTIGNKTTAYQYNKNDELLRTDTLHTDTEKNDVVIYKNDKNGNQLATVNRSEIPAEAKDTSYIDVDVTLGDNQLNDNVVNHYNALNQLTETLTKNYKVSFTYDAEGLRTGKTVNGEKTVYVWDGDQVVMELSKGGAVQKRYIRGNDLVYADKGENTEKTYYVTDMHGNVVQLLDESGNVTKTYEYDSFGNEVKPEKKDENPYRYCGEYYDKETEEVYLRARYYEPGVGRFITRDTYTGESDEPLSLHLYTYCENDGVNAWDPSGHWGRKDGKYVHQEITKDAYENVKQSIKLQILHTDYEKILQGSIVPDYYKKKTIYLKDTICGIPLRYDNMFHGKNAKKLKKLKKIGVKKLSKRYLSGNKYIFLGCILHSIQDYFAHSYVLDLEKYKKNALEYADHPKKYQKYNSYHSDWSPYDGVEGRNVTDHQRNKDNPDMNYERVTDKNKKSYWKWVDVKTREKNKRYVKAIKESKKYINKVLKNVSTI